MTADTETRGRKDRLARSSEPRPIARAGLNLTESNLVGRHSSVYTLLSRYSRATTREHVARRPNRGRYQMAQRECDEEISRP